MKQETIEIKIELPFLSFAVLEKLSLHHEMDASEIISYLLRKYQDSHPEITHPIATSTEIILQRILTRLEDISSALEDAEIYFVPDDTIPF